MKGDKIIWENMKKRAAMMKTQKESHGVGAEVKKNGTRGREEEKYKNEEKQQRETQRILSGKQDGRAREEFLEKRKS